MPNSELFTTGVDPEPALTFKAMGKRLLDPDREIYSRNLRIMLLRSLAFDPDERYEVHDLLKMVQQVLAMRKIYLWISRGVVMGGLGHIRNENETSHRIKML